MKPMMILAPGVMSKEDQQVLRDNGICVVEAEKPELVRFVDPLPAASSRTQIENAAIKLSRLILNGRYVPPTTQTAATFQADFSRIFVECLVKGTAIDLNYVSPQIVFDNAKEEEICRLAREEAKAERAAAKAAKKKGRP